jgi:hypothetical protein
MLKKLVGDKSSHLDVILLTTIQGCNRLPWFFVFSKGDKNHA